MKEYDEAVFEAALEITASAAEDADLKLNGEGGRAAAAFFRAVYEGIAADGEEAGGGVFEVYKDKGGEYRFRLKAPNGEVIAASEGYSRKESCMKGIECLRKYARMAEIRQAE